MHQQPRQTLLVSNSRLKSSQRPGVNGLMTSLPVRTLEP